MSHWDRVVEIYNRLADLPRDEQDRRLRESDEPEELVAEVRSLLDFETSSPSAIDRPQARLADLAQAAGAEETETEESDPERVGPYRVLRRIGSGGMGVILLAERDDGAFEKRVAVKLIKRGMDSEALLGRFQAERQILATLEHPAIARLLDGGISDDGRPYLVLEHVAEALSLDEYCRAHRLSLRERLELFRRACLAVHSAHQKLVLHRDIKPSNLLVSGNGELKLLDFGIAKLLTPDSVEATRTIHRMATPAYAAPEQLAGEAIGTYTDVYSLGVVLFELLTGSKPGSTAPSTALTTDQAAARRAWPGREISEVRSNLRGDLDTIVTHCLAREPERRYPSAQALAEDLERYLEKRPILARPPSLAYQARKLVARHPAASALALTALLALGLGIGGVLWQSRVARAERDRAAAEAGKAGRLSEALESLFDMSNPVLAADAKSVSLREVIERTEAELAAGLEDEPEVRAKMLSVLGGINIDFVRYDVAERQLVESVSIYDQLYPDGHLDRAEALTRLSRLRGFQERREEARTLALEAIEILRSLAAPPARLADALERLGTVAMNLNRLPESEEALLEALELRRSSLGPEHQAVGKIVGLLAVIDYRRGRYADAVERGEEAVEIRKAAVGPVHQQVAHELNNLGAFLLAAGERPRAREVHREALEVRRQVFGSEHPYVAFSFGHLATIALIEGDLEAALDSAQEALRLRRAVYPIEHSLVRVSTAQTAAVLVQLGRAQEALELLEPAVEATAGNPEIPRPATQGDLLVSYGRALLATGAPRRAESALAEAVELHTRALGAEHDRTASSRVIHARALLALGEIDRAEAANEAAFDVLSRLEVSPLRLIESLELRACIEEARGDPDAALAAERRKREILIGELGSDSPRVVAADATRRPVSGCYRTR